MNIPGVRRANEALGAWRLFQRCPVVLPWFRFARDPGPQGEFLRLVHRIERAEAVGASRVKAVLVVFLWLAISGRELVANLWRYRALARGDPTAPGSARQCWQMLVALLGDNISPISYYLFRLYRRENWPVRHRFLLGWQLHPVFVALDEAERAALALANDKLAFWQRCRAAGLPVVAVVAAARAGRVVELYAGAPAPAFPAVDLVFKPVDEYGGHGIEFFFHQVDSGQWSDGNRTLDAAGVLDHLCRRARLGGMVLQPRIANHPTTEAVSNGFLVTLRVVTERLGGGPPYLLAACCRMPSGDGRVANLSGSPVLAAIDLATGRLAQAERPLPGGGLLERHPDSGQRIAGVVLPFWDEVCQLALQAHEVFGSFPTVGWDIVLSPEGPLLLEFNTRWASSILQLHGHTPLGLTRGPECYLAAYRRLCGA